ncbi:multicopper oxidase family protein [Intrasporangium sp.]|uniref:multicopper oxidase family protein n=1 Tax=Intrasporangium sp. TaxID=1925024 RepID=UPI00293954FB|nr:multicopper oxidase family protein [Intrasporangium sp.]MDV3222721.1 multicopper oxidase family protein [Intrasporangium sp.]
MAEGQGMTRRQALTLAGAGALSAGVGVAGLVNEWGSPEPRVVGGGSSEGGTTGMELRQPDEHVSSGGELALTLSAVAGRAQVAGRSVECLSYNGSVPGPTLRVRAGDRITLDLDNRLGESTNLHVHGLQVSPSDNSDNVFLEIKDGETFRYEYDIAKDHPAGTFWYHPHLHHTVADQLWAGLCGAIIIERDDVPSLGAQQERVLVITDVTLAGDRVVEAALPDRMLGREGDLVLVNGQLEPVVTVTPGGHEHWRVVNACCSRFLRLRLDGAELRQVAGDVGPLAAPTSVEEILLAPGNRADLLVRIPGEGTHELIAEPVDRGSAGMGRMGGRAGGTGEAVTLLRVNARGDAAPGASLPAQLADLDDLRDVEVDQKRVLTFAMGMGFGRGMSLTIDDKTFDAERVDQSVRLGTVEEWTIENVSPMDHPFHLHVWPMNVVSRDGSPVEGPPEWKDVVIVPAGGNVTVRMRIKDFPGRTVYHCHILDHEDLGMMGLVEAKA